MFKLFYLKGGIELKKNCVALVHHLHQTRTGMTDV